MKHIPLNRYSLGDLIYMANHGGAGSLNGLYLKAMKDKGLVVVDCCPTKPHAGYDCTMTNKGWLCLLQKLGYDEFLLEEMWDLLEHYHIDDSRPFWQSLYKHYQKAREAVA